MVTGVEGFGIACAVKDIVLQAIESARQLYEQYKNDGEEHTRFAKCELRRPPAVLTARFHMENQLRRLPRHVFQCEVLGMFECCVAGPHRDRCKCKTTSGLPRILVHVSS